MLIIVAAQVYLTQYFRIDYFPCIGSVVQVCNKHKKDLTAICLRQTRQCAYKEFMECLRANMFVNNWKTPQLASLRLCIKSRISNAILNRFRNCIFIIDIVPQLSTDLRNSFQSNIWLHWNYARCINQGFVPKFSSKAHSS